MPVDTEWDAAGRVLTIMFDKPLMDQPLNAANWILHLVGGGSDSPSNAVVMLPASVNLTFGAVYAPSGLSIRYLAASPDVVGENGLPVAPFDFLL